MLDALRLTLNPLNLFRRRARPEAGPSASPAASPAPPILASAAPAAIAERERPAPAGPNPAAPSAGRAEQRDDADGAPAERRKRRRRRKPAGWAARPGELTETEPGEGAAGESLAGVGRFGELTLSSRVVRAVHDMGYEQPSPVQTEVIPHMLARRDVVGQAQTGTGKTAAFGIPLVECLDPGLNELQAIVLVPTRELALQVSGELKKLSKYSGHRVVTLYGGQPIIKQFVQLDPMPQIVVGTPGRVLDHMGRNTIRLDAVRIAVLDEADEMLDIGFAPDMERILRMTPKTRQTALFSATMPPFIVRMIQRYLKQPVRVHIAPEMATVPEIDQVYYEVAERDKLNALASILKEWGELPRALVFCRMQVGVDRLTASLKRRGYHVEGIHGGLTQGERTRVMAGFRQGDIQALIATNVAARGLDIPDITHVVSYDAPQNAEEYVHRIGRTGRFGRSGLAVTFIGEGDFDLLDQLVRQMGDKLRQERCSIYAASA